MAFPPLADGEGAAGAKVRQAAIAFNGDFGTDMNVPPFNSHRAPKLGALPGCSRHSLKVAEWLERDGAERSGWSAVGREMED
jgi:hypothetical protein